MSHYLFILYKTNNLLKLYTEVLSLGIYKKYVIAPCLVIYRFWFYIISPSISKQKTRTYMKYCVTKFVTMLKTISLFFLIDTSSESVYDILNEYRSHGFRLNWESNHFKHFWRGVAAESKLTWSIKCNTIILIQRQ